MPKFPFLSEEWIVECRNLREEFKTRLANEELPALKVNLVVTDVPFSASQLNAHIDTSAGEPEIDLGHLSEQDATISLDYKTAKAVLVDSNFGAAMEAMQLGRIQIDGDMLQLMGLAGIGTGEASAELAQRMREITE